MFISTRKHLRFADINCPLMEPVDLPAHIYARLGRSFPGLMPLSGYEAWVKRCAASASPKRHKQLRNMVRKAGVAQDVAKEADLEAVVAVLLDYSLRGAEAQQFLQGMMPAPAPVEAPKPRLPQNLVALEKWVMDNEYHKVLSFGSSRVEGTPRKKQELYAIAMNMVEAARAGEPFETGAASEEEE